MKIIKYLTIILILILATLFLDMMKINYHHTNKRLIEFSNTNINSTFYKKIYTQLDEKYENFLLNFFSIHSNYWIPEDDRERKKCQRHIPLIQKVHSLKIKLYMRKT